MASVMFCTLRAGFGCRNRRIAIGGGGFQLGSGRGAFRQGNQFAGYDGARRHFNDPVVDVAIDPRLATQHQALARVHIAVHRAVHHDTGDLDAAFDETGFAHRQRTAVGGGTAHIAVHPAVEMQSAGEFEISVEIGRFAEQRVDARGCLLASPEHFLLPRSAHCGSTLHTYDCCTGAEPRRLDLTSTSSCSGFMPGGIVISSSMFSRYRNVKGISRRFPPESVAKSARPGLPSSSPSTDKMTTPLTTVSGFMGWTSVTRMRNLLAAAVATIRACWIFTSAEFAFWVTIPRKKANSWLARATWACKSPIVRCTSSRSRVCPTVEDSSCAILARSSEIVASPSSICFCS